ncbi:Hypothetical protein CINCED_3A021107 [Cinara cedri]|uniref:Uncharacterized protein n=1 Tax=Cinara cedri TaxID=506608 RepID=A0A5E4MFA9_9HEMI|nr:Hypothetical protein CINCED_3A021107 [Cinara cedri]
MDINAPYRVHRPTDVPVHFASCPLSVSSLSPWATRYASLVRDAAVKQRRHRLLTVTLPNREFTPRMKRKNAETAANTKITRINIMKMPGFIEIDSSHSRKIVWYYAKNIQNFENYKKFLLSIKPALILLLKSLTENNPIKFNLKLEATYFKPQVENSTENRAFKTSAREIFFDSEIEDVVEEKFAKLLKEEDIYQGRGSGFSLQSINGVLLGVYKYTPMGGSSYIPLPADIKHKRAVINSQNTDEECFKWAILAKHVTDIHRERVNEKYREHEDKYNFNNLSFPTPLTEIKNFEKNNSNVSVNDYGLKKEKKQKNCTYRVSTKSNRQGEDGPFRYPINCRKRHDNDN